LLLYNIEMGRKYTIKKSKRTTRRHTRRHTRKHRGGRGYTTGAAAELKQMFGGFFGCGCGVRK
jgi:hypothetical protein